MSPKYHLYPFCVGCPSEASTIGAPVRICVDATFAAGTCQLIVNVARPDDPYWLFASMAITSGFGTGALAEKSGWPLAVYAPFDVTLVQHPAPVNGLTETPVYVGSHTP